MTRDEYIENLFSIYDLVSVLSEKNGCQVLRIRHKKLGKNMVLRSYASYVSAYDGILSISHSNLPRVYDSLLLEDGHIVLEEFIEGIAVSQVMETGRYKTRGTKRVLKSVLKALSLLHQRGIVHRDIKPENVIVAKDGRVVLIDFDAARKVSVTKKDTVVMGTVGYASPEQLGLAQSDARTDIYAVGVLLNVMLTGKHPSEKMAKGRMGRIVRKCTDVSPKYRYQSAEKLSMALW